MNLFIYSFHCSYFHFAIFLVVIFPFIQIQIVFFILYIISTVNVNYYYDLFYMSFVVFQRLALSFLSSYFVRIILPRNNEIIYTNQIIDISFIS